MASSNTRFAVTKRLTPRLAEKGWVPVPGVLLRNQARLPSPTKGDVKLRPTEVLLLIHVMDYKWDELAPYPTVKTLARRMGITTRSVQTAIARLVGFGLLGREPGRGRSRRFKLDGLFKALEHALEREERERREKHEGRDEERQQEREKLARDQEREHDSRAPESFEGERAGGEEGDDLASLLEELDAESTVDRDPQGMTEKAGSGERDLLLAALDDEGEIDNASRPVKGDDPGAARDG